ncbi:MAG: NAD(P)-binding domain-containing protein [Phycisphaerales bacterium]|nr:NAD(P)-binding domain-containing protein [Phycisphaerales bacterium]
MHQSEVAIVGAGPIGLEAAVALGRAGVSSVVLEAGEIGATFGWWAPGTRFFSSPERIAIAGVPLVIAGEEKATREDYLRYLRHVAQQFAVDARTFERVVAVERAGEGFELRTVRSAHGVGGPAELAEGARVGGEAAAVYRAEKVVLAIGDMHRPRLVGVPGENLPHVSHYLQDPHVYYGRRVVIVGGRNSAVEAAIRLYRVGAQVTLCQRKAELERDRIKYWLLPELEWLIEKGKISFHAGTGVREIGSTSVVMDRAGAGRFEVAADAVLLLTGYVQDTRLFDMLGIDLVGAERRPRFDHDTMETNAPGVYVAGTAVGGSQARARVFIENSHEHVERIVAAIAGRRAPGLELPVFEGNEES